MKNVIFLIAVSLALTLSCKNNNKEHDHLHEDDSTHLHAGESTQSHEAGSTHTHEADAEHSHEADAEHSHEPDAALVHEGEDPAVAGPVVEYSSEKIIRKTFHMVQRVSGTILTDKKGEIAILASSPGIISFSDQFLYPGIKVNMGTNLFTISGADMSKDNPELEYKQLVADYNRARQNFERAKRLIEDKLITEEHYLVSKNEFERLSAEYSIYGLSDSSGQRIIKAPKTAYIKEVLVEEGEYVNAGDKLLTVQTESKLILKADIPPASLDIRSRIKSAKFACAYSEKIFNTEDLNGKLISYGRSGSDDSFYIPLFFKLDFTEELIPGTFADIWLIGEDIEDAITIPNSAIMEEFGKLYVFIDHEGHFDKRFIEAGGSDGQYTQILSGLSENELVVTQGTYQVKMSMMTSVPNSHQHSH